MLHCLSTIGAENGLMAGLFMTGLATGFSHCAGMCGPFVLAQMRHGPAPMPVLGRLSQAALLPYHAGRLVTYTALGALAGTVAGVTALFSPLHSILSVLALSAAALIFIATAIPLVGSLFPALLHVRLPVPARLFAQGYAWLARPRGATGRFGLGLLMGFMPCGMVIAALLTAAVMGTPAKSALAMAAFAVGTLPGLFTVALGGQTLSAFSPAALKIMQPLMLAASIVILLLTAGHITIS